MLVFIVLFLYSPVLPVCSFPRSSSGCGLSGQCLILIRCYAERTNVPAKEDSSRGQSLYAKLMFWKFAFGCFVFFTIIVFSAPGKEGISRGVLAGGGWPPNSRSNILYRPSSQDGMKSFCSSTAQIGEGLGNHAE